MRRIPECGVVAVWAIVIWYACLASSMPAAEAQAALDEATLRPVDAQVRTSFFGLRYNRSTQQYSGFVTVTNTSSTPLPTPLYLVVTDVNPKSASLVNAPHSTLQNHPYYDLSTLVPGTTLAPQKTTLSLTLTFRNPTNAALQINAHIFVPQTMPPVNRAPLLASIGDRSVREGAQLQFTVTASDPDGDQVQFSTSALPANASFDPVTGAFIFQPDFTQAGTVEIIFTVTDNRSPPLSTSETVRITILDRPPPVVMLLSPEDGALTRVTAQPVMGTVSDPEVTTATLLHNGTGQAIAVVQGAFTATLTLFEGLNTLSVSASNAAGTGSSLEVHVRLDMLPPHLTITTPSDGAVLSTPEVHVTGTVDDPSAQVSVDGQAAVVSNGQWAVPHVPLQPGPNTLTVLATDVAGNSRQAEVHVTRQAAVLQALSVAPVAFRLTSLEAEQALTVSGVFADGATQDLTAASTGTTYVSSNPFVATVNAAGVVQAVANGAAIITAQHQTFSATASVTVEVGVTLETLALSPTNIVLRTPGATQQLSLSGTFSDGSTRGLTAATTGTLYTSSAVEVATVSSDGLVTAMGQGEATMTAAHEGRSAQAMVTVSISAGPGFLRGEVYDDTRGLQLAHATVTLLEDGSGPLPTPTIATADEHGQFLLSGASGEILVRIGKMGFTNVERRGIMPAGKALVLLDARLTPLDPQPNPIPSAFGGQARDTAQTLSLNVAPGSLTADTDIRLTALSNQGLQGRLPLGWSPIAAADIQPAGLIFAQPVTLRVPNPGNVPPLSAVTTARYDGQEHRWRVLEPAQVTADGTQIICTVSSSEQVVFLAPDAAPFTPPPAPVVGHPLLGVDPVVLPAGLTATGEVIPRSAPPGDTARATGRIELATVDPVPSGTQVQANVHERFDLFDGSQVIPIPFTQDLLLYAYPRTGNTPLLSTYFPITPSHHFTIQELQLGLIQLDVTAPAPAADGNVIGVNGGPVTDLAGNIFQIPPGALTTETVVRLLPRTAPQLLVAVPDGCQLLSAVQVELIGGTLSQGASLSVPRPATLPDEAQVLIAQVFSAPDNVQRLRLVALGQVQGTRLVSRTEVSGLTLPGLTTGGQYLVLQPDVPVGFITGVIFAPAASAPQPGALVTADTAPFADLTATAGVYIVAAQSDHHSTVTATEGAARNTASDTAHLTSPNAVFRLDLTLGVAAPTVVSTTPSADAVNVPLNTPIVVQFSKPMDATTVTAESVVLRVHGTAVQGQRTLSPDGQRVTLRPTTTLQSKVAYTLLLTSALRDLGGNSLTPFMLSFTTLDTSRPPQPPAGQITAALPDADGLVMLVGTQGTAEPGSAVTATNLRTQGTVTVLAASDGTFRARLPALLGDELALTFRNAAGQPVTTSITQFENPDGTTVVGSKGGTVTGPGGRLAQILSRALIAPATLKLDVLADTSILPPLPADFSYVDHLDLTMAGGPFNRLQSLTLSESQNRFTPHTVTSAPFAAMDRLVVPADFLVTGTLTFASIAEDAGGNRTSLAGSTLVVDANPDTQAIETAFMTQFPSLFLSVPGTALPNQQVQVQAVAPAARIDFELPAPDGLAAETPLLLVRLTQLNGEATLAVVDTLEVRASDGRRRLKTAGRMLPGATSGGPYAVLASTQLLAFATGRITGPATTVRLHGAPLVFETASPNAAFRIPVPANQPFTLTFVDPISGQVRGTATGQAPASGDVDVGEPLGAVTGQFTVQAQPDASALVDINAALVFTFSEPIDRQTVTPSTIVVTDLSGNRIFGSFAISSTATQATFTPSRRWRFGTTYRYGISSAVVALSGAQLQGTFNGQFTTFTPRLLGNAPIDTVRDVAISGNLALAGGETGVSTLDITQADRPMLLGQTPINGGVAGVALLPQQSFTDRNGQQIMGPLALAVSGTPATVGELHIVDVNTPATPVLLGTAQLTVPTGQSPPPGVPNAPGAPHAVVVGAHQRAVVAVQSIGIETVELVQAIPDDPAHPGASLGPRYPATGFENANQVAVLHNLILVAGAQGLTILDGTSLAKLGHISTTGNAQGIAALAAFRMDINGDGSIDPAVEVFDLAVVANGQDGTLQLFNIQNPATPQLLSVVRLACPTAGVELDATENLAYVGCGTKGVAIIDLTGPASVQPLDLDRNSVDDRLLGLVSTGGSSGRLALNLSRGAGYVADGARGLTVVQLLPPRAQFETIVRDPIEAATGDEESMAQTHAALTTDDALQVSVRATIPPQSGLSLAIQEVPAAGGSPLLTFPDGTTSTPLMPGVHILTIRIRKGLPSQESQALLKIQESGGRVINQFDLRVVQPAVGDATLQSLFLAPQPLVIASDQQTVQLSVGGVFSDGRILNLSAAASGTTYAVESSSVATINGDGMVTAVAGGITGVLASSQTMTITGQINVVRPPVLTVLQVSRPFISLTAPGAQQGLVVQGRFSDGRLRDITQGFGTQYSSSAPHIVTVSANGVLTATGEGSATVTVMQGTLQKSVRVAVAFRLPPDVTGLTLAPFTGLVTTDQPEAVARASVRGTGSLEGLTVTFQLSGITASQTTGITDYAGVAVATLTGLVTPGTGTVTASIVNPASGVTFSDSKPFTIQAGSGDNEPNNDITTASTLAPGKTISGTIDAATDPQDTFRLRTTTAGTLTLTLTLPADTNLGDVQVVVLSGNGLPLGRFTPTGQSSTFTQPIDAEQSFLAVATTGGPTAYTLATSFTQSPVVITSVSPTSGGPNTLVTINGSGFSTTPAENTVLFATIAGKLISATTTQLQVTVPANAVNGPMLVIAGSMQVQGPLFVTGKTGPLPPITLSPVDPAMIRLDPVSGDLLVVNSLLVTFDPVVSRAEVNLLAANVGGTVVGVLPTFNTYVLEFPALTTIAELEALRRQIETHASVRFTSRNALDEPAANSFDLINIDWVWPGTSAPANGAYYLANIPAALIKVRATPPFDSASPPPFKNVTVAVIDSGFMPLRLQDEFQDAHGHGVVQLFDPTALAMDLTTDFLSAVPLSDLDGHGTAVTSIIATVNNHKGFSGILNSLFLPNESPFFQILVYKAAAADTGKIHRAAVYAALEDIQRRNALPRTVFDPVDVVNMSFGRTYPSHNTAFQDVFTNLRSRIALLVARTLVTVGAGNDGVDTQFNAPAALAAEQENVMNIGAVAVANVDGTGERADARGIFLEMSTAPQNFPGQLCSPTVFLQESNCGPGVTMAAPGEDVLVAMTTGTGYGGGGKGGTSLAAPMVAGTASILQAIRQQDAPFTPRQLRDILVRTADDISSTWNSNTVLQSPMRRLNALAAVLAVLPPPTNQRIYAADEDADNGLNQPKGKIIAIEVDPLNGHRTQPLEQQPDQEIALTLARDSVTTHFTRPTAMAVSPAGDGVYAVVQSVQPDLGDGVLVINTQNLHGTDFIAFAMPANPPVPVKVPTLKSGIVFSQDGRLLYVATGTPSQPITIINTVEGKVVASLGDLPFPYRALAGQQSADNTLRQRLSQLAQQVQETGAMLNPRAQTPTCLALSRSAPEAGVQIPACPLLSSLALSPDGKTLYAGLETGSGGGDQPGAMMAIDVDLYQDTDPDQPGLQSALSTYFTVKPPVMQINNNNGQLVGDEPRAVAVSADGKHVYLVTGGLNSFQTLIDTDTGSGVTLLVAPGYTGVFNRNPAGALSVGAQEWQFLSTVDFGWNASGGAITQQKFGAVYARRPFGMAIRPDGKRFLVPYYQTGNFGVLDLDVQALFRATPPSIPSHNPVFDPLSAEFFHALVAVTTALQLDDNLWPGRGVLKAQDAADPARSTLLPSPDEALLFPWDIAYAQNGRFAVGSHVGAGPPKTVSVLLPDFMHKLQDARAPLQALGFTFVENGGTVTGRDPQGTPVSVGQQVDFQRGGGAISIINDQAITADFALHAEHTTTASQNTARAYYASIPVCKTVAVNPATQAPLPVCAEEVVTHLFDYSTPQSPQGRFVRPRGVALQPFVTFEAPRFGDVISATTGIQIRWRDPRINSVTLQVSDLNDLDAMTGAPNMVGEIHTRLTSDELQIRTLKRDFMALFSPPHLPTRARTYRIEARVSSEAQGTQATEISRTHIDVAFETTAQAPTHNAVAYTTTEIPATSLGAPILTFPGNTQNGVLQVAPAQAFLTAVQVDGTTFPSTDGLSTDEPIFLFDRPYTTFCIQIGTQANQTICPNVNSANFANFSGSTVQVGLMDARHNVLREVRITLLPARIDGPERITIATHVDRLNNLGCPEAALFKFPMTVSARVTLKIDGQVVLNAQDFATGNVIPRFEAILFAAGNPAVLLLPNNVGLLGEHTYVLEGKDIPGYPGESLRVQGQIFHEVKTHASLPLGHTMIKGVDIWDGHLTHTAQDVRIPGRGLSLEFGRTYSSAGNSSDGPLGAGWTHSYTMRLMHDSCGRFVVIGGEGSGNAFTVEGTAFHPQIGYHSTLVRDAQHPQDEFDFFTVAHVRYHFKRQAALAGEVFPLQFIEEPNGNRITLDYVSGDNDPATLDMVTDASGRSLLFTYQEIFAKKRMVKLTGQTSTGGNLLGLEILYTYDEKGNLTSVTRKSPNPTFNVNDARTQSYTYTRTDPKDPSNLLSYTDPNGHTTNYIYYSAADTIPGFTAALGVEKYEIIKTVQEPENVITHFTYNFSNNTRAVTDPRPQVPATTYTLNNYGATVQIDAPLGKTTVMAWCTDAPSPACPDRTGNPARDVLMISQTDAEGRTTNYEYLDQRGNLTRVTMQFSPSKAPVTLQDGSTAVGQISTHSTYEPTFGRMTSKTDAEGNTTAYLIDATYPGKPAFCPDQEPARNTGNLLGVQDAEGNITCYAYAANGDVLSMTDPRDPSGGRFVTRYTRYDPYGNAEEIVDPQGNITTNSFDERSRLRETRNTFTRHTRYAYDGLERKIQEERLDDLTPPPSPRGTPQIMTYTYKPNGEQESVTDGLGQATRFVYDGLNRNITKQEEGVRQADGSTVTLITHYGYDQASNAISETDPRGITRSHTYDALNRRTQTAVEGPFTPNEVTLVSTYDLVNNKLTETDHHGHTTSYGHDGLYRAVETQLPFPNALVKTGFDRMGNTVFETDANGNKMTYVYDAIYRLTRKTDADGNTMTFAYDQASNKTREANLSSSLVTEYLDYDGLDRPQAVRQAGPGLPSTGYTTSYEYQDSNNAVVVTDPRGFKKRIDKDGLDRVLQTSIDVGSLNLTTTFTYDGNGNVKTIQDPEGGDIDVTHIYDGLNRKIRSTYVGTPNDNGQPVTEEFVYDGNNNLIRYKDKRGIVFTTTYDNLNRVLTKKVKETITNGGAELTWMTYAYDDLHTTVTETDANGNVTTTESNGLHRPTVIDDPDPAGLLVYEYDGVNKRAEIDKKGQRTAYDYDAINRLTETREFDASGALQTTMHVDYLDEQNQKQETDRRGIVTTRQFDALQRLLQHRRSGLDMAVQYGADEVLLETFEYDGNHNKTAFIDGQGNRVEYTYDGADRQMTMTEGVGSPVAATTTTAYNKVGNVLTVKDGRNHGGAFDVQHTYDARYRKVSATNGEAETTTYAYDANNNLTRLTEPLGASFATAYRYDELNKLLTVDETPRRVGGTAAGVTRFFYDGNRNKIAQQDANDNLVTYTYDGLNRLTDTFEHTVAGALGNGSVRGGDPRGGNFSAGGNEATALHWHFGYDLNSNQHLVVDARGQRIAMTHDYLDRLETKTYSQHAEPGLDFQMQSIAYTHDGNGNVLSITEAKQIGGTDVTEHTDQTYDGLDRLQTKSHFDHDDPVGKRIEYDYDIQGNRTGVIDPDGVVTTYTYDARNRLDTATTTAGVTRYTYWEDSLLKSVAYPNGAVSDHSAPNAYDRADRITRIDNRSNTLTQHVFSRYIYTYDRNGNRVTQEETQEDLNGGNPETTAYTYDNLNRLLSVTYKVGTPSPMTLAYTYEPTGNRLTEQGQEPITGQPVGRTYTYAELPEHAGATFNHVNVLTQIVDNLDPNQTITYAYDRNLNQTAKVKGGFRREFHFGIRDEILAADELGGTAIRFDYNPDGLRIKKLSAGSGKETRYLYDERSVLVEYNGAAASLPTFHKYDYGYNLLSLTQVHTNQHRGSRFYHTDGLMSTVDLTDEAGGLLQSYRYDAWGRIRDQVGTSDNPRQYTGHYKDDETALHYFGARYYDDETGRFLAQDPYLGTADTPPSLHRYLYAYANPLRFVDLMGHESSEVHTINMPGETIYYRRGASGEMEFTNLGFSNTTPENPCKNGAGACGPTPTKKSVLVNEEDKKSLERARQQAKEELAPMREALERAQKMYIRYLEKQIAADQEESARLDKKIQKLQEAIHGGSGDKLMYFVDQLTEDIAAGGGDAGTGRAVVAGLTHAIGSFVSGTLNVGSGLGTFVGKAQTTGDEAKLGFWDYVAAAADILEVVGKVGGPIKHLTGLAKVEEAQRLALEAGRLSAREGMAARAAGAAREGVGEFINCLINSFVADTQIVTDAGHKNIAEMKIGDKVWSRNLATGQEDFKRVQQVLVSHPTQLVHLQYRPLHSSKSSLKATQHRREAGQQAEDGDADSADDNATDPDGLRELIGTPTHPFWSLSRNQWVSIARLNPGEALLLAGGQVAETVHMWVESATEDTESVYNLEIEDWQTYYVASSSSTADAPAVWVHNACGDLRRRTVEEVQDMRRLFDSKVKKQFLQYLSTKAKAIEMFGKEASAQMARGLVPEGFEVHHIKPLFRGGTNSFKNLDLVDKAFHKGLNKALHLYEKLSENPFFQEGKLRRLFLPEDLGK